MLGGLIKRMPRTALFVLIGSTAISAFPPLNGFVSEWLTYQSLLAGLDGSIAPLKIFGPLAAAALALTGALAAACFVKAFGIGFLGQPRSEKAEAAKEASMPMLCGMGMLALLCALLGLWPKLALGLMDRLTESLTGAGALAALDGGFQLTAPRAGFANLSMPVLGAILILGPPLAMLAARAIGGKTERRRYETWACGLRRITSRMQYTATAYTKPLRIIFSLLYRPSNKLDASFTLPYFARRIRYETRIESIVEKYLYEPIVAAVMRAATRIRVIQSGSIHAYLAYIFAALVLLLIFAR
jgi:hydrogenase-4 component B